MDSVEGISQYSFDFFLERHLTFYIYRILIPLALIIIVGWAILFIDDHDTRIAASSGNLLVFITFNFTIADDIPRLGYLTFLDALLILCFIITSVEFAFVIYLRRLDKHDRHNLMVRLERLMLPAYPVAFIISLAVLGGVFLV